VAVIRPFRAVRYNDRLLAHAACLMTPPYDVISPDGQEFYYDQSPFNVIRLDYGREFPDDTDTNNRYTRSRDFLANWLRDGVLVEDDADSIYGYRQVYRDQAGNVRIRDGFVALLLIEEWSKGTVYPHERTSSGPKQDRLRLVRATGHQMSFIFSLFSDPKGETAGLIADVSASPVVTRYTDEDEVEHILTRCTDQRTHAALNSAMDERKVFIADGHHRYETFLAFREEAKRLGTTGDAYRYAAMYFTPLEGEGLTILPCHRIVALDEPIDEAALVEKLEGLFTVQAFEKGEDNTARLLSSLSAKGKGSFGFYPGNDRSYLLTLTDRDRIDRFFPAGMSDVIKGLDVSILQHVVITGLLGIAAPSIVYSEDARRALGAAAGGRSAAFLVNPTTAEEVREASLGGERMPQKSTFFFPKLSSGLGLYRMVR
jgi:uncharacterized protein (DUF1015 family)